jgi:small acid-soluble spore protein H (minor)
MLGNSIDIQPRHTIKRIPVQEGYMLNKQRAKEISESPVMANVLYNGKSIYIQHVDEQNETARIYPIDQPESEKEVSLSELLEQ